MSTIEIVDKKQIDLFMKEFFKDNIVEVNNIKLEIQEDKSNCYINGEFCCEIDTVEVMDFINKKN